MRRLWLVDLAANEVRAYAGEDICWRSRFLAWAEDEKAARALVRDYQEYKIFVEDVEIGGRMMEALTDEVVCVDHTVDRNISARQSQWLLIEMRALAENMTVSEYMVKAALR